MVRGVSKIGFRPVIAPEAPKSATPDASAPRDSARTSPAAAGEGAFHAVVSGRKGERAEDAVPGSPQWWARLRAMQQFLSPKDIAGIQQAVAEVRGGVAAKLACLWVLTEVLSQRAEFTAAIPKEMTRPSKA